MQLALEGKMDKRMPLDISPVAHSNLWVVEDGNSTLTVARIAGWPAIWCRESPDP